MKPYRLKMKGIIKKFPGVLALDEADFILKPGEVHALVGINGAGKSTLIKVLSGIYQKDAGQIFMNGKEISINKPEDAIRHGITTVYQDPQMVPSFTGYENIFLGFESNRGGLFPKINRKKLMQRANKLLEQFPVDINLTKPVNQLEAVEKEIVAILRALSKNMSILVLDEPTSILTENEKRVLFDLIQMLKEKNISIIYITHRLEEVYEVADRLTVYRDGKNVDTLDVKEDKVNSKIITELMLDEKLDMVYPGKAKSFGDQVVSVKELSLKGEFDNVSFKVKQGEILGLFGLVGSGIEALSKALFGVYSKTDGIISLQGHEMEFASPDDAIDKGIYLIPGNRKLEGEIYNEPVFFNISLSNLNKVVNLSGLIKHKKEKQLVEDLVDRLNINPPDINNNISFLSGGNQQKVVIGKGLFAEAELYIFAEPTVGVDVGAKMGIYNLIRELAKEKAVIIISSDCEEVYGMSDHVMVMHKGEVALDKDVDKVSLKEMLLYGVTGGNNENAT